MIFSLAYIEIRIKELLVSGIIRNALNGIHENYCNVAIGSMMLMDVENLAGTL